MILLNSIAICWKKKKKRDNIYFLFNIHHKIKFHSNLLTTALFFLLGSREAGRTTLVDRPTSRHRVHYEDVVKFSWGGM